MGLIAFVIGGADCVFDDIIKAHEIVSPDVVIAVNDAIAYYGGNVDIAATLHPRYLIEKQWIAARKKRKYNDIPRVFAQSERKHVTDILDYQWPEMTFTGSSGHYGVKVALEVVDASHVVCCGIPMDTRPHFNDPRQWEDVKRFWEQWELSLPRLSGRVKSMSGRTRDLLGEPSKGWINGARD